MPPEEVLSPATTGRPPVGSEGKEKFSLPELPLLLASQLFWANGAGGDVMTGFTTVNAHASQTAALTFLWGQAGTT